MNGLGKKRDNLIIKNKIEAIIKKKYKDYYDDYQTLLNLQLRINKNKISKIYHPIRVSYYSTFFFQRDIKLILFAVIHNIL